MTIKERVELYKSLFGKDCKALDALRGFVLPMDRIGALEALRELDTHLSDLYMVSIPVITCWVRDNSYVRETGEIYLTEPDLEAFLHQYRHHLQNEAREQKKKLLLVEEKTEIDSRIPYKEAVSSFYGEDDAIAWAKMLMEYSREV